MQRRPGGGDPFFDFPDPFTGFGTVGNFGGQRSLLPSFFGGSPFDDPFFRRPFGSMFESSFFGPIGSPFAEMPMSGFLQNQPSRPINRHTGPVIEEINSDDENEEETKAKKGNPKKHSRSSKEPYVEEPDDAVEERRNKHVQLRNNNDAWVNQSQIQPQPQSHSYSFQSSTVTYGGSNGAYYTSSKTRRTGSDGLCFEESKEADTTSGRATHSISRGIHDKGHSLVRNLNSDGKVDTKQTLHNIDEDQLAGFEAAWEKNGGKHLPGRNQGASVHGDAGFRIGHSHSHGPNSGGWALPSTSRPFQEEWNKTGPSSRPQQSKSKKVARRQ